MALVLNDRVKETTTTTGTGDISLAGAVSGFETFVSGIGNANTTYYCIAHKTLNEFEIGIGTINDLSTDTISGRSNSNVLSSTNSDNVVDFSAGEKSVFCTLPASKAVVENANNEILLGHTATVTPRGGGITKFTTSNDDGYTVVRYGTNSNDSAYGFNFARSKNASIGGNTILASGDAVGSITWFGDDGNDFNSEVATIKAVVTGTPGSNTVPGILQLNVADQGFVSASKGITIYGNAPTEFTEDIRVSGGRNNITNTKVGQWDTAYSWGDHSVVGYLTAHPNISAASSSDNSGQTFIQDITVDSNGHITAIGTATSSGGVSEALAIAYATAL